MHLPAAEARRKVQLTAVLKDPRYLSAIREPTEKVQLAAVQKNPECIRHIAEPTEKVQHMAVQRIGYLPADQAA